MKLVRSDFTKDASGFVKVSECVCVCGPGIGVVMFAHRNSARWIRVFRESCLNSNVEKTGASEESLVC